MKDINLKAGNFTIYVKKAAEFIPGLRFNVGILLILYCKGAVTGAIMGLSSTLYECRP